jgi:hypothetical protein
MPAAGTALGVAPVGMKKRGRPKGSTNKPKPPPSPLDFIGKISLNFSIFFCRSLITVLKFRKGEIRGIISLHFSNLIYHFRNCKITA